MSDRITAARKTVANTEKMKNELLFFKDKFIKGEGIPKGNHHVTTNHQKNQLSRIPIRSPKSLIHAHLCEFVKMLEKETLVVYASKMNLILISAHLYSLYILYKLYNFVTFEHLLKWHYFRRKQPASKIDAACTSASRRNQERRHCS